MEFHERLQQLRRQQGLTQQELAQALYVSRTAISKWESGRGYPNIDSLRHIAAFFCVTVDELLGGGTAQSPAVQRRLFAWLDMGAVVFWLLPLFARRMGGTVQAVSLWALREAASHLHAAFALAVCATALWGILCLAGYPREDRVCAAVSLLLGGAGTLLFVAASQPYAAALGLALLAAKAVFLLKSRDTKRITAKKQV